MRTFRSGNRALFGLVISLAAGACFCAFPSECLANNTLLPTLTINTNAPGEFSSKEVYTGLKLSILLSAMVFIPTLFMTVTCFPKIAIVLALTRQALGIAQTPPNQVIMGMSLFLTFAIMGTVFERIYNESLVPYGEDQIGNEEMLSKMYAPLRDFMIPQTREQDIMLFTEITKAEQPDSPEKIGAAVLIPAFIISELSAAFQIAFLIYLPFLVLDLIISSVLTSMSMITLPPTVISLPIKLMLFVLIDGWGLIIGNLVRSYNHFGG